MGASLDELDPKIRAHAKALVAWAEKMGWGPRVTSTYRSTARQRQLYRRFLEDVKAGRPNMGAAKPGSSRHEYRMAFDVYLNNPAGLAEMARYWKAWGGTWGGDFRRKDPIHFDYRGK